MTKHLNEGMPVSQWPREDVIQFSQLYEDSGIFSEAPWGMLSAGTIQARRYGYGQWLGFLRDRRPDDLHLPPAERVTREAVLGMIEAMRRNCSETAISIVLQRLHLTVRALEPSRNWAWLLDIQRYVARHARVADRERVRSVDLYRTGIEIMEDARGQSIIFPRIVLSQAELFQEGLMIALLAEAPMRRANFAALRLGGNVVKMRNRWRIYLQGGMVKTHQDQDFEISHEAGDYMDDFIGNYRPALLTFGVCDSLWIYDGRAMTDKMIRRRLRKHTEVRLGTAVSPHGFRRAAATFVAEADPENVRSVKDLLGHQSFSMTEKHYISPASTRRAGRELAKILIARAE